MDIENIEDNNKTILYEKDNPKADHGIDKEIEAAQRADQKIQSFVL